VAQRSLHIAWLGAAPLARETGGVAGVAADLLEGLAALGHRIDCFVPGAQRDVLPRIAGQPNVTFVWGTAAWRWNRWYSRTRITAFASGLLARGQGAFRQRRAVARRHAQQRYDVIYQFSNIESLSMPTRILRAVPLVIHPETHMAGELRSLLAERALSLRCQPAYMFAIAALIMGLRSIVQRARIRRARLLVCISAVFRDHLIRDYGFPAKQTVVIPNPVRLERFTGLKRAATDPPTVLVLGRVSVRKGIEDVVALARVLLERDVRARVRVVGGPSLFSDYTKLLDDLPGENSEYAGRVPPADIPAELARASVLLQPSKYEPFALTVAEGLAAGVPVVATTEVGAAEQVDGSVAVQVSPGDIEAMANAIEEMLARIRAAPQEVAAKARAEAARLFGRDVVCNRISEVLQALAGSR
jgi:glycosyltransferase involved in cell wall biosynthesis